MIPAKLTRGPPYRSEWGIFEEAGLLIGIREDAPDWVKERYRKDCEIMTKATETMFKE